MFITFILSILTLTLITIIQMIAYRHVAMTILDVIGWLIASSVTYGLIYFGLPPLRLTTIIAFNTFWLILGSASLWVFALDTTDEDKGPSPAILKAIASIATFITIIGCITLLGIHINTNLHVKESYDTINIKDMKSKVAPTLRRGETPVAIAPATIFNKISKDMSDVPNSNAFVIANDGMGNKEIQAQYYQGKPVYIIPIQFRGFFQYTNNHGVIPGYFRISATDPDAEPEFVKTKIYYGNHQWFSHNVNRLIYKVNPTLADVSDNAQLEIDNNGRPYYVKTMFLPDMMSNRLNYKRLKVAVVDAQTGAVKFYDPSQSPKFIDENLTSDAADDMNNDFGSSVHGWWNSHFGQKDVKKPTENGPEDGVTTVFNANGTISYLTDFTSTASSTNSALGYSMIDARTGQLKYYTTNGIMDTDGAIDNANKNYHAQNFHAEMPVLYSIDGHATWVMSILDSSGLQRGFYYVDGANPSIHADGSSITATLDSFRQLLANSGGKVTNTMGNKVVHHHGTVTRCFVTSKGIALFTINNEATIYQVDTTSYQSANLIRPNDTVSFTTGGNGTKNTVTNFKDSNLA